MDSRVLRILQAADDPEHYEYPPDFDWRASMKRVEALGPSLERIIGHAMVVDRNVQDASYFTDLSWKEPDRENPGHINTVIAVRFSSFGNLFTVWNHCPPNLKLSESTVQRVVAIVEQNGLVG